MSKKHKRSAAQIAASRVNGALSKGPVTAAGKAISARNSLTHGLHAANPVLQGESQEAFDAMLNGFTLELFPNPGQPPTFSEACLLRDIASARWRRERTVNMKRVLTDREMEKVEPALRHLAGMPDLPLHMVAAVDSLLSSDNFTPAKLERQESRLERLESRARTQLLALRAAPLKVRELALEEATLAAATMAAQSIPKHGTSSEPSKVAWSSSGNNLTVLIPAATTPDRNSTDKAA